MSWQALAWAGKLTVGSPAAKSLLILLANFADEAGECFPTFKKLSEISELSERAVQNNIQRLEDAGLIVRSRKRNDNGTLGSTRYRLCLEVTLVSIQKHDVPVEPEAPNAGGPQAPNDADHKHEVPVKYIHQNNHQLVVVAREGLADPVEIETLLRRAAGNENEPSAALFDVSTPLRLMRDERCDLHLDVLPTVRRIAAGLRGKLRTWSAPFLTKAILEARDRREAGLPEPDPNGGNHGRSNQGAVVDATLRRIAQQFGSGGSDAPTTERPGADNPGLRRGAA